MSRDDSDDEWNDPSTDWDDDQQYGDASGDDWRDDEWDDPDVLDDPGELRLTELFTAGGTALVSTTGIVLAALMTAMAVLSSVVTQSILGAWVEFMRDAMTDPEMVERMEQSGVTQQEIMETLDGFGPFPLAFDLPAWLLLLAVLVPPFVAEAIRIVGVRAFAANELDGVPGDLVSRRLVTATILGWFGGTLLLIGTAIGLGLLIVPGVFVAIVTAFYRQEVAVADKGVIGAIRGSYTLSKGHWMELFGLLFVLAILGFGLSFLAAFVAPPSSIVNPLASAVASGVMIVFSMAVITEAYVHLRGGREDDEDAMYS